MAYKKLSEATFVENIMDTANVLIEENDEIKRVPENVIGRVKTVNGTKADENGNVEITTSWNDLEDRPFGVSEIVKVPVLAEQTLSFAKASDADPIAMALLDIVIEEGKTYEFVFDGEVYKCDSFVYQEAIGIGNMSLVDASIENTNEPFVISYHSDGGMCMMGAAEGDYTVSIAMMDEQVKKIDEKYLPISIMPHLVISARYDSEKDTLVYGTNMPYDSICEFLINNIPLLVTYIHIEGTAAEYISISELGFSEDGGYVYFNGDASGQIMPDGSVSIER